MTEYKVGDRVQKIDGDNSISEGTILQLFFVSMKVGSYFNKNTPTYEDVLDKVEVIWDDGSKEVLSPYKISFLDSELEREFRNSTSEVLSLIKEKVLEAETALNKAVAISEKYGIPFSSSVSFLGQSYTPETMSSLHPDIDQDLIDSITSTYDHCESGWQHSAVC